MTDDPLGPLDPDFALSFRRDDRRPPCQLYLISPLDVGGGFADRLVRALDAGAVAAFQFRVKDVDQHDAARLAEPLRRICADRDVAFIVNDSISLAKRLGADGVHLGQDDGDPREARHVLGPEAQIGVTCHDSRHLAMDAGEAGADYVAFGAFYPTTTKAVNHRPEPVILSWWAALFEIPAVAIGGITPANAAPLVKAGADFLAVSGAVWGGDEAAAVRAFAEVLGAVMLDGGCECGAIRYRLDDVPIMVNCCHCRDCQTITGSAFALNAMIETDRIAVTHGAPEVRSLERDGRDDTHAWRCATCATLLWADHPMFGDAIRFVRAGTLDHAEALVPDAHYFMRSRHPWVMPPHGVPQFETVPAAGAGVTLTGERAARMAATMAAVQEAMDPRRR